MKIIIGVTGGIASGKSTLIDIIKASGYYSIDADVISHDLMDNDSSIKDRVLESFPEANLNGNVNRAKLGNIIFNDSSRRKILNNIMHPVIYKKIKDLIDESKEEYIFLDVPLLFETGFDSLCDTVILVYTGLEIQIERLIKRDHIDKDLAIIKINSQMNIEEKKKKATYIIDNSDNISTLKVKFDEIMKGIIENAKKI